MKEEEETEEVIHHRRHHLGDVAVVGGKPQNGFPGNPTWCPQGPPEEPGQVQKAKSVKLWREREEHREIPNQDSGGLQPDGHAWRGWN